MNVLMKVLKKNMFTLGAIFPANCALNSSLCIEINIQIISFSTEFSLEYSPFEKKNLM